LFFFLLFFFNTNVHTFCCLRKQLCMDWKQKKSFTKVLISFTNSTHYQQ
jgi:hypothetical protein